MRKDSLYKPLETRDNHLNRPDSHLEYMIKDCSEAVSANPLAPKTEHYLKLARACQAELIRRLLVRIERERVKISTDVLQWRSHNDPNKEYKKTLLKHWRRARAWDIDMSREGALAIGLRKLHLTKQ